MKFPIAYISTYPPKQCGIATYTYDLLSSMPKEVKAKVVAITDQETECSPSVFTTIRRDSKNDYCAAAEKLNNSSAKVVHLEHEFGLFGGEDGNWILDLLRALEKPLVTTFHTILSSPTKKQLLLVREISLESHCVIVMAQEAKRILTEIYQLSPEKIAVIHHGVPDPLPVSRKELKAKYGFAGRKVISSFGLLSRGKGMEYAIDAMGKIKAQHRKALFLIIGKTHPNILKLQGEQYRTELKEQVEKLGLEENVKFIDEFLDKKKLIEYLTLTDIYLTPYPGKQQITSGTLAYAVGLGKATVSTPFIYAKELLDSGRGLFADFCDSDSIARELDRILSSPTLQKQIESKAFAYGKYMRWSHVAKKHFTLYRRATGQIPVQDAGACDLAVQN
jgi:glycosyltransferase involved in cell wall biosynthesis